MDYDCRNRIVSDDYASLIVKTDENLEAILTHQDYCFVSIDNTYSILYAPVNHLPDNLFQLYGYEPYPNIFGLLDIASLEASGITRVRNIPTFNLLGQGTLVGIVDTGIEYTHSAFRNADGTTRILSIWDQTIQSDNPPEGFLYGTEYSNDQINQALQNASPLSLVPSTDTDGHGTMVAGIAAGSISESDNFSGVVPNAELVVVKLKPPKKFSTDFFLIPDNVVSYEETDILMGLNYLLSVAKKNLRPISICLALGTFQGSHDEFGVISSFVSNLAEQRGVSIVIAGGNEGNRGNHYQGTVSQGSEFDTVELKVGPNEQNFSMELWGNAPNTYSIDILSPSGEYIPRIPARLGESRDISFIFERTKISVNYALVEAQTGDELILIKMREPTEGIWRFRVYASGGFNMPYHIWLPIHNFISDQTFFMNPSPDYTLTSPGNTYKPIVTVTYDLSSQSIYLNSGRGYTRNNRISPTLAAPGVNMIVPTLNNSYQTATGSSIAAAHTAGAAAMLLEWGIIRGRSTNINGIEIKNILIRGTKKSPTETYPNRVWGYGILDVYQAFESLRTE